MTSIGDSEPGEGSSQTAGRSDDTAFAARPQDVDWAGRKIQVRAAYEALYANSRGEVIYGDDSLASRISCATDAARRAARSLEEMGLLTREPGKPGIGSSGVDFFATVYRIVTDPAVAPLANQAPDGTKPRTEPKAIPPVGCKEQDPLASLGEAIDISSWSAASLISLQPSGAMLDQGEDRWQEPLRGTQVDAIPRFGRAGYVIARAWFDYDQREFRAGEMATRTGLPSRTVNRRLQDLERHGLASRTPGQKWRLKVKLQLAPDKLDQMEDVLIAQRDDVGLVRLGETFEIRQRRIEDARWLVRRKRTRAHRELTPKGWNERKSEELPKHYREKLQQPHLAWLRDAVAASGSSQESLVAFLASRHRQLVNGTNEPEAGASGSTPRRR